VRSAARGDFTLERDGIDRLMRTEGFAEPRIKQICR